MLSDKQKRIVQLAIVLFCIILAGIFLSPLLNHRTKASGLVGGIVGVIISIAIFPETLKAIAEQPSEKRMERLMDQHQSGFYRYLTHPTQIPLTLAGLLFISMILVMFLLDFLKIKVNPVFPQIGLSLCAFLWGLSGFLMLTRNEFIDHRGRRYRGVWAIIQGIGFLLMGWGGLIFVIIARILDW